jgi:hypothetical protein
MPRPAAAALIVLAFTAACSQPVIAPLQVERGMITVNNRTSEPWNGVEIWINRAFRVTAATIDAGARFQVPVNSFVAGYGQRFDFNRMQIKDVRLTAKTPAGEPVEHTIAFRQGGLEGAFGEKP